MEKRVLSYSKYLKHPARNLRKNMTDSEVRLWSRLRRKQLLGVQFYRQRPIGKYIVDFFAPKANLVIEVDGSQHRYNENETRDRVRNSFLEKIDILVLRFNSREVITNTDVVIEKIYQVVKERIDIKSP